MQFFYGQILFFIYNGWCLDFVMALRKPRFKTQRRLGNELAGLGKPGALERRPYPPGESGNKRKKYSDYALRLEEKQKLRCNYVLKERQLRRFIRDSKKGGAANWVHKLASLLESRLDNIVFRLGFAPSLPSARQLICHGHVQINGKKASIASQVVRTGENRFFKGRCGETSNCASSDEQAPPETSQFLKKRRKRRENYRCSAKPARAGAYSVLL